MPTVTERVAKVLSDAFGVHVNDLKPDSHLVDDLGADSLDSVELLFALEEEFGFEIEDEDGESLTTVQKVQEYVASRMPA
jgi:acyl carrier protein